MKTFEARVKAVMAARDPHTFVTAREGSVTVDLAGIPGDRHYGLTRPADSRQRFYPRGTDIANRRQISIVSVEELAQIAERLGLPEVLPEWLGANLLLEGYPSLTLLPQGARLLFPAGTGLIGEGENLPCPGPGEAIAEATGHAAAATRFTAAAKKRRGIVCSVERIGTITEGDTVQIMIE
ncbi:MOSC domain-containing protein [Paenibacillus elgii]|uniref:MOSC domain-containing protein n=1 Tax=Paenibacillus elgii TaxID=189691 RepID=A0A2T6GAP7_9BACL|nr:MOSC domain-containing protein [Paenibacillus elgii]PUA41237.1 MOSC domain-containing protein [Paenibacillus elgii]